MPLLVALPFAAAGYALGVNVLGALRRALNEYQARVVSPSLHDLHALFLFLEPQQVLALSSSALFAFALLGLWLGGWALGVLGGLVGLCAPQLGIRLYRRRRLAKMDEQLVDGLQLLANALRAGHALPAALEQVALESERPLSQELGLAVKEIKLGVGLDEALGALADRVGSADLSLAVTAIGIARQLGGNLAEVLETIAATVRDRFRLEGRIDALTSQGRMQGVIVSCLPLALGLFLHAARPDLVAPMFRSAFGYVLITAIAVLETLGFLLVRKIVAIDV